MSRTTTIFSIILTLAWLMTPRATLSQTPGHVDQGHNHAGEAVSCTTLASPPWTGLPNVDREQFAALREAVSDLKTPEAARAAGFNPTLGDIPGMGVHYVNTARSRDGVQRNVPDHLLFCRNWWSRTACRCGLRLHRCTGNRNAHSIRKRSCHLA